MLTLPRARILAQSAVRQVCYPLHRSSLKLHLSYLSLSTMPHSTKELSSRSPSLREILCGSLSMFSLHLPNILTPSPIPFIPPSHNTGGFNLPQTPNAVLCYLCFTDQFAGKLTYPFLALSILVLAHATLRQLNSTFRTFSFTLSFHFHISLPCDIHLNSLSLNNASPT